MKAARVSFIALIAALFFLVRVDEMRKPWVNLLETGFQEAIALNHLKHGIIRNRLLPVIAEIDGVKYFHTAHPPLLHAAYAGLYRIAGAREWITRLLSLALFAATAMLWYGILAKDNRSPFIFFPLAFFFPLSFALARTTNYEPLALFMVTLVAVAFIKYREKSTAARLALLIILVTLAMLTDWPAYLAVPALLILNIRKKPARRMLSALLAYEALFLAATLLYQRHFAGETAFFGHAMIRSDPQALLQADTYKMMLSHLAGLCGKWPLALYAVFLLGWLNARRTSRESIPEALAFFTVFAALLVLSAPQLVARHYVHLLYFAPALTYVAYECVKNSAQPSVLIIASVIIFAPQCYSHLHSKNFRYLHASATLEKAPEIKTMFSSSATGMFRYYNGIETLLPVSRAAEKAFAEKDFDVVLLESRDPEVSRLENAFQDRKNSYKPVLVYPDEVYYLKNSLKFPRNYVATGMTWPDPAGQWWQPRPAAAGIDGRAFYAIYQPPGPQGASKIEARKSSGACSLEFSAAVHHQLPLPFAGDGASFMVLSESERGLDLNFFRHIPDSACKGVYRINMNFHGPSKVYFITGSGPGNDYNYDDAYWLEAEWSEAKGGE